VLKEKGNASTVRYPASQAMKQAADSDESIEIFAKHG
jgi:hypothetical protein